MTTTRDETTICTVCRFDYGPTLGGQHTHSPWLVWGPGFRVCRRCVHAGRDARRLAEREHKNTYRR